MNTLLKFILLMMAIPLVLLVGCYKVSEYSGDGQLIDNGLLAATDRYVLRLGSVRLDKSGTTDFQIANLPATNFVVGIEITVDPKDHAIIEKRQINPTILLELSGPDGVIFMNKSDLDSWSWSVISNESQAFVYGRGESGTYFNALQKSEYTLTFGVLDPDFSQSHYSAQLVAKSGGWK